MGQKQGKSALLLLGAFAFGYNAATALHEFGHALAMWTTGGAVRHIALHPFSWSFTVYGSAPRFPMITAWAGAAVGSSLGLLLLILAWRWRSAWATPLLMTALCAFFVNGLYLGVDGLLMAGGDATCLIARGVPPAVTLAAGTTLLALGLVVGLAITPRLGLGFMDGVLTRMFVFHVGVGPYLVAMLSYHLVFNRQEAGLWLTYVLAGFVLLTAVAVASRVGAARWAWLREQRVIELNWPATWASVVLGVGVVALELLASGH